MLEVKKVFSSLVGAFEFSCTFAEKLQILKHTSSLRLLQNVCMRVQPCVTLCAEGCIMKRDYHLN